MSSKPDQSTVDEIVRCALNSWTALRIAIQHGFVEGNTDEKYSLLSEDLKNLCRSENVDQFALEELLESSAYHDFNFLDEDKSFKDLAKAIIMCFNEIKSSSINDVIAKYFPSVTEAVQRSTRGEDVAVEVDEESALSEMICETVIQDPKSDSSGIKKQEPIIDDDGFQLVQPRRKR